VAETIQPGDVFPVDDELQQNPLLQSSEEALDKARGFFQRIESRLAMMDVNPRSSHQLLGVLPIRRVIPQDVHSMLDYSGSLTHVLGTIGAGPNAMLAGAVLAAAGASVSMCTDYRLSVAKLIPIEVHEVIDYVWGAAAIAAPFALGYFKKDKVASFLHIGTGVLTIVASMFTDYRAARGVSL